VGEVYSLYRVKTDISVVLTVKSGLDHHMIIEFEDELNCGSCFLLQLCFFYTWSLSLIWVLVKIYILVIRC
jgi:hypothetical protein